MRRHGLSGRKAKKLFAATAARTRAINLQAIPMRGGFRI